mmetsp:Transcript_47779/g.137007  ORF Transcript_47779/g.137007 Transcript_47779/m.137007 type:complete len:255 (+) Transcript_47779:1322-2086(+)
MHPGSDSALPTWPATATRAAGSARRAPSCPSSFLSSSGATPNALHRPLAPPRPRPPHRRCRLPRHLRGADLRPPARRRRPRRSPAASATGSATTASPLCRATRPPASRAPAPAASPRPPGSPRAPTAAAAATAATAAAAAATAAAKVAADLAERAAAAASATVAETRLPSGAAPRAAARPPQRCPTTRSARCRQRVASRSSPEWRGPNLTSQARSRRQRRRRAWSSPGAPSLACQTSAADGTRCPTTPCPPQPR